MVFPNLPPFLLCHCDQLMYCGFRCPLWYRRSWTMRGSQRRPSASCLQDFGTSELRKRSREFFVFCRNAGGFQDVSDSLILVTSDSGKEVFAKWDRSVWSSCEAREQLWARVWKVGWNVFEHIRLQKTWWGSVICNDCNLFERIFVYCDFW